MSEKSNKLVNRWAKLVNKKYCSGLTAAETIEMEEVGKAIDKLNDSFYEKVISNLKKSLQQKEDT